ncbi:MAG: alkylmercury lyase MerB [Acidimicrobiales bacterium]
MRACTCTDAEFIARYEGYELVPHLVRLLAGGRPLPLDELAEAAGAPVDRVRSLLGSLPGGEWDDQGRLVGFGLTLRPTAHHFVVGGQDLYTWCATDTLLFTVVLGRSTSVHSICAATGRPVDLELSPQGPLSVSPPEVIVSQVSPASDVEDFRRTACDQGHFFASAEHAKPWLDEHVDGLLLGVAEAFAASRAACEALDWVPSEQDR